MPDVTAFGPQPIPVREDTGVLTNIGIVGASAAIAGFSPYKSGRVWDAYIQGIRAVETAFPGAILRTFRVSEFLSPLETWSKVSVPRDVFEVGGKYPDFLRNIFGPSASGIQATRIGTVFGEVTAEGKPIGLGLRIKAGTQKGAGIADYYARLTGTPLGAQESLNESLLRAQYNLERPQLTYREWVQAMEPHARRKDLIIGARFRDKVRVFGKDIALSEKVSQRVAKAEVLGNLMRAKAATTAGRLNTLLSKPLEIPVVGDVLNRIPVIRSMAVEPGSAFQMATRFTKKALVAGAVWKGLEYYDYARTQGGPWSTALGVSGGAALGALLFKAPGQRFSPKGFLAGSAIGLYTALAPRFDEGLFYGAASLFTDANVLRARVSRAIGLTGSLQEQEEITPGLISPKTALAFGGIGAMAVGMGRYGGLVKEALSERFRKGGLTSDIFERLREVRAEKFAEDFWNLPFGKTVSKFPGGKYLSKIKSPIALGFVGGLATWGALSSGLSMLSGNFGAAIPGINLLGTTETPEELEAIYSGEEEVAVRKGRWWEMGRSTAYEGGKIDYFRHHFIHRLRTRAYQKGLWGSEEERWAHDSLLHPLKALYGDDEWKYYYESKYQFERPAPITSTYGENIPFFGPLIAATFGKALKPRKLVRPEEWMLGGGEFRHLPDIRGETEPVYELGGLRPGAPVMPDEGTQLFNELMYRRREAVGLVGFAEGAIQKALTGKEEVFPNLQTLGVMGKETGSEYWLWSHLNLGGALAMSEPIRRFIPRTRSYLETYNPLCLTPDSTVIVNDFEPVSVKDLGVNSKVSGLSETIVKKIYTRETEEWIYGFQLYSNLTPPYLTGDHPVYAIKSKRCHDHPHRKMICHPNRKNKKCKTCGYKNWQEERYHTHQHWRDYHAQWTPAKDLRIGDFIGYPIHVSDESIEYLDLHDLLPWYSFDNSFVWKQGSRRLPRYLALDYQFGYICGLYLSEGSGNHKNNTLKFSLHKNELGSLSREIQDFFSHYNIKSNAYVSGNKLETMVYSKTFIDIFEALFNKHAHRKKISRWLIRHGPNDFLIALVHGFLEGDGSIEGHRSRISLATASFPLAIGLREILLSNRIVFSIHKTLNNNYMLSALSEYEEKFVSKANLSYGYKLLAKESRLYKKQNASSHMHFFKDNILFTGISKIHREFYSGIVYDLTVEEGSSFCSSEILLHNSNTLPSWMPDDYFLDLKHGNPFQKIKEAEIRLPGPGYSAFHPEVAGLHPEDYPLVHRLKILGDVAMWSDEYKQTLSKAKREIRSLSDYEKSIVKTVEEQVKSKKQRRKITEYRFRPELLEEQAVTVTEVLDPRRIKAAEFGDAVIELQGMGAIKNMSEAMEFARDTLEGRQIDLRLPAMESRRFDIGKNFSRVKAVAMIGDTDYGQVLAENNLAAAKDLRGEFEQLRFTPTERLAGRISESVLHRIETPLEMLTPVSPASKLIRQRSAIEEYIATEAIGTGNAFWDRPVENFLKPAADMALYSLGFGQIPENIRQRRNINEYFDMLSWVKSERAEREARLAGEFEQVKEEQQKQQETLFGLDVFGSPVNAMKALPRRERDFFAAFAQAPTEGEREQIFSLIPENEQRLYIANWLRQEERASRAKEKADIAKQEDQSVLAAAQKMRRSEGFGITPELEEEWLEETGGKVPYDEWIRDRKAAEYFATHSLPGADWIGWSSAVDLEDVKLKYVEDLGLDHHDFDLWGARKRSLVRKPYISDELIQEMSARANFGEVMKTRLNAKALGKMYNDPNANVNVTAISAPLNERYDIQILDKRDGLVRDTYKYLGAR